MLQRRMVFSTGAFGPDKRSMFFHSMRLKEYHRGQNTPQRTFPWPAHIALDNELNPVKIFRFAEFWAPRYNLTRRILDVLRCDLATRRGIPRDAEG